MIGPAARSVEDAIDDKDAVEDQHTGCQVGFPGKTSPASPTESSVELSVPPSTVLLDLGVETLVEDGACDSDARSHVERIAGSRDEVPLKVVAGELPQRFKLVG